MKRKMYSNPQPVPERIIKELYYHAAGVVVLTFLLLILTAIIYMSATEQRHMAEVADQQSLAELGAAASPEVEAVVMKVVSEDPDAAGAETVEALDAQADAEPVDEHPVQQEPVSRYADITEAERDMIARMVYLEANGESAEGQQAVAEVILNRVAADNFPDSVQDVLYQGSGSATPQFSAIAMLDYTVAGDEQYMAVDAALYGENILPLDVVFFSRAAENSRVWGTIGNHVFCYQYIWN